MEELGADALLHVRLADDGGSVVARTEGRKSPAPGQRVALRVQPDDVFAFHPVTGARLAGGGTNRRLSAAQQATSRGDDTPDAPVPGADTRVPLNKQTHGGLMRAIVLDRPGSFRVAQVPDPMPGPGQIVVKVDACGICGTDIHIMDGEFPPTPYPITPGHEFAGTVAAVGGRRAGSDLPVGAQVAVDPSLYCGYCRRCRSGRDNLCENWAAIGDTVDGAFAEYVAVPAANAHRLPDGFDGQLGAMIEPLACAVHGLRRLGPVFGDTVVLTGAGTMGLLLLQLLVHAGAGPVTVVDRVDRPARGRPQARRRPDRGQASTTSTDERFEIAVDATGVPAVVDGVAALLDRGGRLLVFGVTPAEATMSLSPFRVYNDEITVTGSMAILRSFAPAVELIGGGVIDPRPLLSAPLPLEEFGEALHRVRAGQGIKWHIRPS